MHIVMVVDTINRGGAGRHVSELANFLVQQDHRVSLIPVNGITDRDNYAIDSRVELWHLEGAPTDGNPQGVIGRLQNFIRMRGLLKLLQADVAFAHLPYGILLTLIGAAGQALPIVACERSYPLARINSDKNPIRRMLLRLFYGVFMAQSDVISGQTVETVDWLQAMAPKTRTIVIPNALSDYIQKHSIEVPTSETKVLLTAGRLIPQKRFDMLIEAFLEVCHKVQDWRLVLIGDGPEAPKLAAMVPEAHREQVLFLGHQKELADWYSRAEIFVLPSEMEGFPNVLVEAMAMNTACVAFDIKAGPKEILKNGQAGILLPNDQHKERLVNALTMLMNDRSKRNALKRAGLYVRTTFDRQKVFLTWMKLAKQLTEKV